MSNSMSKLQIGEAQHKLAMEFAAITSPELDAAMVAVAKAKDEFSGAPIRLMFSLLSTMPEDKIDLLPRIGSRFADTNNPEIFIWKDPSKEGATEKEVSFYVVWADNTPEGTRVVTELDWLARLSSDNMVITDIPAPFKAKYPNPEARNRYKKYLNGRRGTIRAAYKNAIKLMHQFDAVNELALVKAVTIPGTEPGTFENVVKVQSKVVGRETMDYEHYSVGSFLKLNAAKAAEGGGTLEALKATVARDTGKGKDKEKGVPALASINTPETSDKVAIAWHSYLDKAWQDKAGDEYRALLKQLTGPGGASSVVTLGGIRNILNSLFKMDKIQSIYDTETERMKDAA